MPTPPGLSQKDADQVLRAVMDDDTNRLRVDAIISPDGHDLEINYQDDSIAIGDPASDNILAINSDGSINAHITGDAILTDVNIRDVNGSPPSATNPLAVEISNGTSFIDPRQIRPLTSADVVTVDQGTTPWVVSVSGTVTTSPNVNIHDSAGNSLTSTAGSLNANITNTVGVTQSTTPWIVDGSATTQPISAVSLPLPTGASTSALQITGNTSLASIDSKLTSPISVIANPAGLQTGLATSQITITSVAQKIPVSDLANRNTMSVRILGTSVVFFGNSSVTTANGYPKYQYEEIVLDIQNKPAVDLWAVCPASQSCIIAIMEIA